MEDLVKLSDRPSEKLSERLPIVGRGEHAHKPPVDPETLVHRQLLGGDFWRRIPAYRDIDEATFLDHKWQSKHTIIKPDKLLDVVQQLVPAGFIDDVRDGFHRSPMSVRVSPYLLSLIDWTRPHEDPLRRQFIPLGSALLPDHPKLDLDSLHEQADAPVPGLTHRYPDKALFLTLDTCPVYCRFCTRSYAVGIDTDQVEKVSLKPTMDRWEKAFGYVASRPELEDIVISGGDSYNLRAEHITAIGNRLLDMPNVQAHALRDQGPGSHAAEDPDGRRVVLGAGRRGRARAQDAQGGRAAHALQPSDRADGDHAAGDEPAVRGRHHGA
jgi:lysine 2,3-aminomutase